MSLLLRKQVPVLLTPAQQAMLAASVREPVDAPYVLQLAVPLCSSIHESDWHAVWQDVAESEPLLHSAFDSHDGQMVVSEKPGWQRHKLDCDSLLNAKLDAIRFAGLNPSGSRWFSLCQNHWIETPAGPLWCLMVHHAVMDGNSFRLLARRLFAAYSDGALWQDPYCDSEFDQSPPGEHTRGPQFEPCNLASCFHRPIAQLEDQPVVRVPLTLASVPEDVRPQTLVHAAWALVLGRALGKSKVTFGVTRHCRNPTQTDAIGPFAAVVPLTVNIPNERAISHWCQDVRQDWLALKSVERTFLSGSPGSIVNVILRSPADEVRDAFGDCCVGKVQFSQRTDIPIAITVHLEPKLSAYLTIDRRQFSADAANSLARTFENVFRHFAQNAHESVGQVELVDASPGLTRTPPRRSTCDRFDEAVGKHANAPAVRTSTRTYTFSDLNRSVRRYAAAMMRDGVATGDIVAIRTGRSFQTVAAMFATVKAGGAFFVLAEDLDDCRAAALIDQSGARFVVGNCPAELENTVRVVLPADEFESSPAVDIKPWQAAYVVATSGTTGQPKLVVNNHAGLMNLVQGYSDILKPKQGDVRYQAASCGGDTFVLELMLYLTSGAAIYIDEDAIHEGFAAFGEKLRRAGVTVLGLPSSMWKLWAKHGYCPDACGKLRAVICSMERTDSDDLRTWRDNGGDNLLWLNAYGPSEAACVATIFELPPQAPVPEGEVPIGRPLPNTDVMVLNPNRRPLPPEFIGELAIGGVGVGDGYLNAPDSTAQVFTNCDRYGRVYHTGDIGYQCQKDGQFVFVGRRDNQVKVRGFRVELEEIDLALCRHPRINDAATVAVSVDGQTRLVAFFAASEGIVISDLQEYIAHSVSKSVVPARILRRWSIPRNSAGKVDRHTLTTEASQLFVRVNTTQPSSGLVSRLERIFSDVLLVPAIGPNENFFDLGGDSLNSLELLVELEKQLGQQVTPTQLLQNPTPGQLAGLLQGAGAPRHYKSLVQLRAGAEECRPLVVCHGWDASVLVSRNLLTSLGTEVPVWGIQGVELAGLPRPADFGSMCASYVEELLDKFGGKPIDLFGYSMGGLVAHETVRQLMQNGGSVGRLFVVDSLPLRIPRHVHCRMLLPHVISRLGHHASRVLNAPEGTVKYVRNRFATMRNMIEAQQPGENMKTNTQPQPKASSHYLALLGNHVPQRISVPTFLLQSESEKRDLTCAWRYLAGRQLKTTRLPYCHNQLMLAGSQAVSAVVSSTICEPGKVCH